MLFDRRTSGVLLHPTSLPGPNGSGDLGASAYHFVDWLISAGQSLWQVLPLMPIGPANSPYMSVSAFAGNPLLVDLEDLVRRGWLAPIADDERKGFDHHRVNYGAVVPFRLRKLREAANGFFDHATDEERQSFAAYCKEEKSWLDDYALFMALDEHFSGRMWPDWDEPLARRDAKAMTLARKDLAPQIAFWQFVQWCFDRQWQSVKRYANERGVRLIGDLPIFVAHHSADCWARPDLFHLDEEMWPTVIAGVPPDFFSATGQRWGNPLYDWEAMDRSRYTWWVKRIKRQLALADVIRIDHFRGFAGYWEIPASEPTAIHGRWVPGPGKKLFAAIEKALGKLPIIAEDLGVITPDVIDLRDSFGLPGMRVLEFAFADSPEHVFLPHNYVQNTVVYTGTHDNDTVIGWWGTCTERERDFARRYFEIDGSDIHWKMIRAAALSVANMAIYQFQDVLGLDGKHRMNMPGFTGYWEWRFTWDYAQPWHAERLSQLCALAARTTPDRLPKMAEWPADKPRP
jgi:4-alpha-glucanotransferase